MTIIFDAETTGLDLHGSDEMFAYAYKVDSAEISVMRKDHGPKYHNVLNQIWRSDNTIVMHNAKFDITAARKAGVTIPDGCPIHDTMIMLAVLRSGMNKGLKDAAFALAGFPRDDESKVKKALGGGTDYSKCPPHIMYKYQVADVERTELLYNFLWPMIKDDPVILKVYNVEIALLWTTMRLESRGMMISIKRAQDLIVWLKDGIQKATDDLPGVAISKPDHVRALLYNRLHLPVLGRTAKTNSPSTAKPVLLELLRRYPECKELNAIMRFRSYSRGIKIVEGYIESADDTDTLRTTINTVAARTGRESSENPNLQNVQKSDALLNPFPVPERRIFRPRPGYVNYHIDFAGIELRLIVHYSQDTRMIQAINRGEDPHAIFASYVCIGWAEAEPVRRKILRDAAKNGHFALSYGAGTKKVAATIGQNAASTKRGLSAYGKAHPGIVGLNRKIAEGARATGYVTTAFGRRVYIDPTKSYGAVNDLIQGTAADVIKRAQINVDRYLRRVTFDEWGILLPVHDELIIEAPRCALPESNRILLGIRQKMIGFSEFSVPMEVEVKISTGSWDHTKEVVLHGQEQEG